MTGLDVFTQPDPCPHPPELRVPADDGGLVLIERCAACQEPVGTVTR